MLTGLVYAAVVALWAVVLVPQWLRRHDRHAEHRTTLTFHRAMRTLERRRAMRGVSRAPHELDVVVAGARSRVHDASTPVNPGQVDPVQVNPAQSVIDDHLDHGTDPFVGGEEEDLLRTVRLTRARTIAREKAARRRTQVQQALIALSVISVVLGFMSILPVFLAFVAPFATGIFWYAARQQSSTFAVSAQRRQRRDAAQTAHRTAQRSSPAVAEASARATTGAVRRATARPSRRYVERAASTRRSRASVPEPVSALATGTDDVRLLTSDEVVARRTAAAAATPGGRWVPVDSPLPTYVDAARADNSWTAQRMLEQAEALRTPGVDAETELGLDEYFDVPQHVEEYEHRRAVND